jgi:hypothetical protein
MKTITIKAGRVWALLLPIYRKNGFWKARIGWD